MILHIIYLRALKAPFWTLEAAFDFLADARAPRKIAVIGTISDYGGASSPKYVRAARRALEVADELIFVGRNAQSALKADAEAVHAFRTASEATDYLRSSLQDGDLVLLKGSGATDGLDQVMSAR
jgi:UDP-N-acetylmuramoyl-tripeptide--D-alanyl-D-alanine ligase